MSQKKPMAPGLVKPSAGLKIAKPPHDQDSLSYTSEKLPKVQLAYADAKHRVKAWKEMVAKAEKKFEEVKAERGRLRKIERIAMLHMGLPVKDLPPDFSDEELEEKTKKLAEEPPAPRPSKAPRLG